MLKALDRMFGVKKIMKKLTHKEFPFLPWKMLENAGRHCSGSELESRAKQAPNMSGHVIGWAPGEEARACMIKFLPNRDSGFKLEM